MLFAALIEVYVILFGGFWGGFILACLLQPIIGFLLWFRELTKNILAKARMWEWLRYKFDSWEGVAKWLSVTPMYEIDMALELPDHAWQPKDGGGYEVVKP